MATREEIMQALLGVLEATGDFKTVGRRNRAPESFTPETTPALMLVEHSDNYRGTPTNQPPVRRIMARAVLYTDVGSDDNAIPAAALNAILDKMDAALKPDNVMTHQFTLNGLVQSIVIDGTVIKAPGDMNGRGLAIVPLTILLP